MKALLLTLIALGVMVGCQPSNTITLYEGRHQNVGVDVLVSGQFANKEVLVRNAVEVQLYKEGYSHECIRVYVNPLGDNEIALARCASGIGFRVVMRTEIVEAGWSKRDTTLNNFKIDFGRQPAHVRRVPIRREPITGIPVEPEEEKK